MFFLKVWARNVSAHNIWECTVHGKIRYYLSAMSYGAFDRMKSMVSLNIVFSSANFFLNSKTLSVKEIVHWFAFWHKLLILLPSCTFCCRTKDQLVFLSAAEYSF